MKKKRNNIGATLTRPIEGIRRQIATMGLVAQGTLTKRTKVCGRPNCRCAQDPAARHGPYFEWTRREKGRYVHTVISEEQAEALRAAIDNHKRVLALLPRWSTETAHALKIRPARK
jgi:hypothetical protein